MAESDDEKRRESLQKMREMRGTPEARPQQILAQPTPPGQGSGGAATGQGAARLREILARRNAAGGGIGAGAAGGAQGARLREFLQKRAANGGAAAGAGAGGQNGARLRQILAQRAGNGGAAGAAPAGAAGKGDRPLLRKILAQRGPGAATAGPAAADGAGDDPEATRARLRDRIGKLQARLDELDRGAGIEDAAVVAETPGPKNPD